MQYDCSQITERLWCGANVQDANDVAQLKAIGVTHVIDCNTDDEIPLFPPQAGIILLSDPTQDDGATKGADWFGPGVGFGVRMLSQPGNVVLTHCAAGVNRGPSMAYAIMRAQGLKRSIALSMLTLNRPVCRDGIRYRNDAENALLALGWIKAIET